MYISYVQVASLATLALLLAALGGSDMSLRYIFVIHVYLGMHQSEVYELWIVRVVEAGSNIVYVAMTQVYSRAINHAVVYMLLLSLCFPHLCLHFNH